LKVGQMIQDFHFPRSKTYHRFSYYSRHRYKENECSMTNFKEHNKIKVKYGVSPFWYQKRNKYNNQKKDGYDSLMERDDGLFLKSLVQQKKIKSCEEQKQFDLYAWDKTGDKCVLLHRHKPDFLVTLNDGRQKVVETKGFLSERWKDNVKLWAINYPEIEYLVSTKSSPIDIPKLLM